MSKEGTNRFLATLNEIFQKKEVVVSGIDESNPDDRALALQVSLRGKTEDEYVSIVNDLFAEADATENSAEKDRLNDLAGDIMSIGELNLGIDWS
ncbi:MAG TPA: hypothetical protein VMR19_02970 [Candidatus Saccharimonadales bacterium]|jgi:hypothetical protein|nr:hypothetical protein [Candidatus Saccharimonadales bacterium]